MPEYSLSGIENNETLVFVHGLGANLRQFELRERFSEGLPPVLASLRGHGGSSAHFDPARVELIIDVLRFQSGLVL